jgi:hypothetical protein
VTKKAIATLAIGSAYADRFARYCRAGWEAYAERHGFDLFVFEQPLDASTRARARSPAWQKCLILSAPPLAGYDRVVWVDSDIRINPAAPSILDGVPPERVGAIDEHTYPSPAMRHVLLDAVIANVPPAGEFGVSYWQAWREPSCWHEAVGLPGGQAHIVQTGVMVLSPSHHRALLERVYDAANDRVPNYEMRPLSYAIQAAGLQHWIDPRFNALVWWLYLAANTGGGAVTTEDEIRRFLQEAYRRSYFLHFAGAANLIPLLAGESGPFSP